MVEQSRAGVLARPNALGERARRSYHGDAKRWVDVPVEVPERLTDLLAFCDETKKTDEDFCPPCKREANPCVDGAPSDRG